MTNRRLFQRLLLDSVVVWSETMKAVGDQTASVMRRLNLGVGALRLTPEGLDELRHLAALQIRHLLEIPDVPAGPGGRAAAPPPLPDPVAIARAMLELREDGDHLDGATLPTDAIEMQVRQHFSTLLDPESADGAGHHPALAAVVTQLTPDEARILRYLHHIGSAPVVDVAAAPRVGRGSRTVAESLSVLNDRAGGDHPDQAPAQLANLSRLGLVRISRRELPGHGDYQLIEASAAFEAVATDIRDDGQRVRVIRRSARLTPLGRELCTLALGPSSAPADDEDEEPSPGTVVGRADRPDKES